MSPTDLNELVFRGPYKLIGMLPRQYLLLLLATVCVACVANYVPQRLERDLQEIDVGREVAPVEYDIHLDLKAGTTSYEGEISIELGQKQKVPPLLTRIVLHADSSIELKSGALFSRSDRISIVKYVSDVRKNLWALEFGKEIRIANKDRLELSFVKPSSTTSADQGLYWIDQATGSDKHKWIGVFDLSGVNKPRQMFPCFDGPLFRSKVNLFIKQDVEDGEVVSIERNSIKTSGEIKFSVRHVNISLRSLSFVIGAFDSTGHSRLKMYTPIHDQDDPRQTYNSAATSTIETVATLYSMVEKLFEKPLPAQKLDIVVVPELACALSYCTANTNSGDEDYSNIRVIDAWGLLIGTRESLLINPDATDPEQFIGRTLNLARALAYQYLGAAYSGRLGCESTWHIESAVAHLAMELTSAAFPDLFLYLQGEMRLRALHLNARLADDNVTRLKLDMSQSTSIKDDAAPNELHYQESNRFSEARLVKSASFWSEILNLLKIKDADYRITKNIYTLQFLDSATLSLLSPQKQMLTMLIHAVRIENNKISSLKRIFDVRTNAPSYELISLREDAPQGRIVFDVQQIRKSSSVSNGIADVFIHLEIIFVDHVIRTHRNQQDVICDSKQVDECAVSIPKWFEFNNEKHLAYVKTVVPNESFYPAFNYVIYPDAVLLRLARSMKHVRGFDRVRLIDDLHGLAKLSPEGVKQLSAFVAIAGANETENLVFDAYLRIRESLINNEFEHEGGDNQMTRDSIAKLRQNLDALVMRLYKNSMLSEPEVGHDMGRLTMRILEHMVNMNDISMKLSAAKLFEHQGLKVPLHARSAFYVALVRSTNEKAENDILNKYAIMDAGEFDEQFRLMSALVQTKNLAMWSELAMALMDMNDIPRRRLSKMLEENE